MQKILSIVVASLVALSAEAGEFTGFVALDGRGHLNAPAFAHQDMNNGLSVVFEPEYYHVTEDYKHTFTIKPFARIDSFDSKRTHFDIRQADWLGVYDGWELRAGVSKVFWGVTESNHLVDIINQTDGVENIDGEDKLGQPTVQLGIFRDWGALRFYYMPYFRERTFAGKNARLRGENPVETDLTTYDSAAQRFHPDVAIRYENSIGDWDLGVAHFSGTGRNPRLLESTNPDGEKVFIPHYDIIDQTSIDLQYTKEGWLWKLEAITRTGQGRRFGAATGGVEYTFYGIAGSNMDLGLLTEYQYDDRSGDASGTFSDNDIFIGSRLTLNDVNDAALLAGVSFDNETKASFIFLEAERRIGNSWKIEVDASVSSNVKHYSNEAALRKDDLVQIRLAKYF